MKILIDLRCLDTASGTRGVGRHTRELVFALQGVVPPGWALHGLSWSGAGSELGVEDVLFPGPRRAISLTDRFVLPSLLKRHGFDLYHTPVYALPGPASGSQIAFVLTIHDLVADLFPSTLAWRHRKVFRHIFRSARSAHRVVTVSENTRRDLLARYPLIPERVVTIPNGVAPVFQGKRPEAERSSGFDRPFLLYVGGLDPLKNVSLLLRLMSRIGKDARTLRLVVIGGDPIRRERFKRDAVRADVADRVTVAGNVDDATLAAAYREAAAFVFPSKYEGFGLPPLEAMEAGCPVVSSPRGSLREVLGEAAVLVEPDDLEGWAEAVLSIVSNGDHRATLVERGRARARRFTWDAAARATAAVYEAARGEVSAS